MAKLSESVLMDRNENSLKIGAAVQVLWKLQDVMYNLDISSRELSEVLNKTPSAIVKLKRQRTMPRINSAYLSSLLIALNQIREKKLADNMVETYDIKKFSQKILLTDLIEFFDPSFLDNQV